jgi:glycosyltransferase involved in cell wall biosynthesis
MPKISVIIPTYNRATYITEAIRSVQAQTYPNAEIIVSDDGSTDNTAEIMAGLGDAVTYIPLPHRGQPAATRNAGLRVAKGEFVAFLDSDDLFLPDKLALQVAAFEAHPAAGLAYSNGHFFCDDPVHRTGYVLDGLPTPSGDIFPELLRGNLMSPPTVLIRRSCLEAVGVFDERPDFFAVEDYDLWLRVAACFPIIYVPGDVAAIRRHQQSISRDVATLRRRVLRVLAKMDALYPQLMREHRAARHEAYARNHGAVALAELERAHIALGLWHGLLAFTHALQMPGLGANAFVAWWQRRDKRRGAASP